MLRQLTLKNFFSFSEETTITLGGGMNILLGINGSGKTSAINALRLLYEGVAGMGFERLFQKLWGGFSQVKNCNNAHKDEEIEVTYVFDNDFLSKINVNSPYKSAVYYKISISRSGSSYTLEETLTSERKDGNGQYVYLHFRNGMGRISVRANGKVRSENYRNGELSGQELVLRQITDPQRFLPSYTIKQAVEQMSLYGHFDTSMESVLRRPCEYSSAKRLTRHGDNLVHLLNYLKNEHYSSYQEIDTMMHDINPAYKNLEFRNFGSQLYLSILETNLSRTITSQHMSDGTLRFLLLLSIFCNPNRGAFIVLDEPEGELHPDMISCLAEIMKGSSRETQIVFATHSPMLLNQFELEDLLLFEKNADNTTLVRRVTENDYPDWQGDYLPGLMWMNGELGAKRW